MALDIDELDMLDVAAVRLMLQLQLPESDQLDYKRQHDLKKGHPSPGRAMAEDVAAFANHRGGLLIYGVDEAETLPTEIVGIADALSHEQLASRIRQAIVTHVFPLHMSTCGFYRSTKIRNRATYSYCQCRQAATSRTPLSAAPRSHTGSVMDTTPAI